MRRAGRRILNLSEDWLGGDVETIGKTAGKMNSQTCRILFYSCYYSPSQKSIDIADTKSALPSRKHIPPPFRNLFPEKSALGLAHNPPMIRTIQHVSFKGMHRFTRPAGFPFWTLSHLIRGRYHFKGDGKDVLVEAPAFLLLKPNSSYSLETGKRNSVREEFYAIFTPPESWHPFLTWPTAQDGMTVVKLDHLDAYREIGICLDESYNYWMGSALRRTELAMNGLERALLLLDAHNPRNRHLLLDTRVTRSLEYLRAHYAEKIDVNHLARINGLSPSRFAHLFKSQTNFTPRQQLETIRLDAASERLLLSSDPVEVVAYEIGFVNAAHFSTRFRKRFKHSPREYREKWLKRST